MVDTSRIPPIPRTFLHDMPATTMNVGLALVSRRSSALADFWRHCAEVREPTELMTLQFNYWSQLVDDYQTALNEGFSKLTSESAEVTARDAPRAVRSA
jgi:hypothetical protein